MPTPTDTNPTEEVLAPTSASTWKQRKEEGFLVRLPSGNVARVRRTMDLIAMLKTGNLPNPLGRIVRQHMDGSAATAKKPMTLEDVGEEDLKEMLKFIDECAARTMVEPKVVIPPEPNAEGIRIDPLTRQEWVCPEDAIELEDLSEEDRFFLFNVSQGGTTDLEAFRSQQGSPMAGLFDGQGVQHDPVGSPEAGG